MARRKAAAGCLLAALLTLVASASAWADFGQRYALVIGNSTYDYVEPLPNTATDAAAVADALENLRFTVFRGIDLDREAFDQLIEDFRTASTDADSVVLYYAGHGFQLRGRNHLVPIDAVLRDRTRIDAETLVLDDVIERIHRRGRQTIVFLDACRNNPLPADVRDGTGDGLAQLQTGDGTFIAFATQPGNVSYDGNSKHSPFTEALLTYIGKPQQSIFELMINVRNEVSRRTLDRQVPWDQSSLRASFSFNPTPQAIARSEPAELDEKRRQGIVISRAVPDAPATDPGAQQSQTEASSQPAAEERVAPGPRIRFGPPPRVDRDPASPPPEAPAEPAQEPAIGRQPVAEQEAVAGQDDAPATPSDPPEHVDRTDEAEQETAALTGGDEFSAGSSGPDPEQAGEAPEPEQENAAAAVDNGPAAVASEPQPEQAGASRRPEETTAAAAADEPSAGSSPGEETQEDSPKQDEQFAALAQPDDSGEPAASAADAQDAAIEEQKVAALPQEPVVSEPEPDAALIEREELVRLIQQNLRRLGCYRLGIDGDWGPGSRSGLERFYSETGETADSLDPSPDVLARLEQESGEVCPPPKVKSPPKKSRVAAPAPKAPAKSTPQRQSAPQPAPTQKAPPKIIGF